MSRLGLGPRGIVCVCISEYAVRAYTTADSAVLYLIHAQIAWTAPSFASLLYYYACSRKMRKQYQCELSDLNCVSCVQVQYTDSIGT